MSARETAPDRYALVGHPVAHSRSPMIHQLFAAQTRQHISYELIDAEPASFETAVRGFQAAGGKGMNVTVPHKEAAFDIAERISSDALRAGAVNTLSFAPDKSIRGDNTDGIGLMRDLTVNLGESIGAKRVLILGAGGAARGIVGPVLDALPDGLVIANRNVAHAEALAGLFNARERLATVGFDALREHPPFDLVINATSVGLNGEEPPFPRSIVGADTFCYDLVYSLGDTPFLSWARAAGARNAAQGWGMLVEQAAESFLIWRGIRPDTAPLLKQRRS
jgi:shikimate dehydrogenase